MRIADGLRLLGPLFTVLVLANPMTGVGSLGQAPPPLPKPKPIVTPPMPKPGQFSQRPKPAAEPPTSQATEPTRKAADPTPPPEASPFSKADAPAEKKASSPSYGTTPVPWPKGSTDPAHFPKGIPQMPGARKASFSMSTQIASAYFLCNESPEEIAKFYLDFATREHWTLVPMPGPPLEGERVVIAEQGDWTLRVDACPDPFHGGTEVFLCASLKLLPPPPKPVKSQKGGKE